jgi:taurine dioxygenase
MAIAARPLAPAIGAEILGADLRRRLDKADRDAIHAAWLRHQVLLFRDQDIDEAQQAAFAACFGEMEHVRAAPGAGEVAAVALFVSNVVEADGRRGALPDGEMEFHTDRCYYEFPTSGTLLYALEIPPEGGDTLFASGYAAYDALSPELIARLERLQALNIYDYGANGTVRRTAPGADAPRAVHPVIRTHPETGRRSVYVNRLMTTEILGLDPAESDELLEILWRTIERPELRYAHRWRPGDLLMWDNRCTFHARTDFDHRHRRRLRRMTLKGDRPV